MSTDKAMFIYIINHVVNIRRYVREELKWQDSYD